MTDSIYSSRECHTENDVKILFCDFCQVQPLIAVGMANKTVSIFDSDECKSIMGPIQHKNMSTTSLSWQTKCANLFVGWESGTIEIFAMNHKIKSFQRIWMNDSIHCHAVNLILWNSLGTFFVCADKDGMCSSSKMTNNSIVPLSHFKLKSETNVALFEPIENFMQTNDLSNVKVTPLE